MERVVITGFALDTPAGSDPEGVWRRVASGLTDGHLPGERRPAGRCAEKGRDPYIDAAVGCAVAAVGRAGLGGDGGALRAAGVTVSSSKGGIATIEEGNAALRGNGRRDIPRDFLMNAMGCGAGSSIAKELGISGPIVNCVSACATGAHSVMLGASWIRSGEAPVVIAGSSEVSLTPTIIAAFEMMGVITKTRMRPFDMRRDGFTPGDGCGVLILEALSSARERGADILCEVSGWASRADAYHMTSMNPDGASIGNALSAALRRAGITGAEVDYINAHGTATPQNDVVETRGIKRAFGYRAASIPISSTKPVTGHLLGAAGAVELIIAIMAMRCGFVPPTAGLEVRDPACDLDYTPAEGRERKVRNAVSLSYGFGGHVAALVISKI